MIKNFKLLALGLALAAWMAPCLGKGTLEGPIRIKSKSLGYPLQYWIYLPKDAPKGLPELYVTDGAGYLGAGEMIDALDDAIDDGDIVPIAAIFVDTRDPEDLTEDRRNSQFMCNVEYAKFFVGELMPEVSRRWTGGDVDTHRGLMGVSFGGINAACFGIMLPGVFQVLIMHSPAGADHLDVVNNLYRERPRHSSAIFLSHGGPEDNAMAAERFVQTLQEKGYPLRVVRNDGGHNWDNWAPLVPESLRAFAGTSEEDEIVGKEEDADDEQPEE